MASASRVMVTGADGFIGSHLVEALVRRGIPVRALVLYNSFGSWGWLETCSKDVLDAVEVVAGDVRDPARTRDAIRGCDVVFHLAALIAIPYSYHAPASYVETNVKGTLNVLQAATDLGVSRIVQTSTSEVYGTARFVPITEEHPPQAQSPYAASKIAADALCTSYHRSFGTPVSIARPFNTFGPRQSARAVIPTIIAQIAAGASRIDLGNLAPTRDFNYVEDTADAMIAVAESERTVGEVVNIGSGFEISIGGVAALIAEVMGADVETTVDPDRVRPEGSEVERLLADGSRMRTLTGWAPSHTGADGLRRGIERTVEWFRDPTNLARYKPGLYNL